MKKLLATILALTLTFTMAFSVSAANTQTAEIGGIDLGDEHIHTDILPIPDGDCIDLGSNFIVEKLMDFVHSFVEKIFAYFGVDCPFCDDSDDDYYDEDVNENIDELVSLYNERVNTLKSNDGSMRVLTYDSVYDYDYNAPSSLNSVIGTIIEEYVADFDKEALYYLENGVSENGVKLNDLVMPSGKVAAVSVDSVSGAYGYEGDTSICISLLPETAVYDGTTTQGAENNALAIDLIDLADFSDVIKSGTIEYYGTELYLWTDLEGKVDSMSAYIPTYMELDVELAGVLAKVEVFFSVYREITVDYINASGAVADYNKALNDLKMNTTDDMEIVRTMDIDCQVVDSSVSVAQSVINKIIDNLTGVETETYVFEDGYDEVGRSPMYVLPPYYSYTDISDDDVVSATKTTDGDETVITLKIKEDMGTVYDGNNTELPVHHMNAVNVLNPATLVLDPIEIKEAVINYPGATIEARLDSEGRLVSLETYLPVNATAVAKITAITFEASLEGSSTETYEIIYK